MYFSGQYNHQLDDKDRFRIPSKLKDKLGGKIFITIGTATQNNLRCLFMYSEEKAALLESKINDVPMLSNDEAYDTLREIFNFGDEPDEDNQGRFRLAAHLKEWAQIEKNLVFAGAGNRVEIWSEDIWNKYRKETEMTPEKLKELFKKLGPYGL